MSALLKLCVLLVICEIYVLGNPMNTPTGKQTLASKHSSQPNNEHEYMNDDDDPTTTVETAPTDATTAAPISRCSLSTPNFILSVAALMPLLIVNKLRN